jgi:WD40 repeat protein
MINHTTFNETTKRIMSLPDGSLACYGVDTHIRIWNVFDKKCFKTFSGHTVNQNYFKTKDSINTLILVSNTNIASASRDCTVRLWDFNKNETSMIFEGHYGNVNCLTVIDKETIASGSDDKTIKIWDLTNGSSLITLRGKICFLNFRPHK